MLKSQKTAYASIAMKCCPEKDLLWYLMLGCALELLDLTNLSHTFVTNVITTPSLLVTSVTIFYDIFD
jgi:hypothetical protein